LRKQPGAESPADGEVGRTGGTEDALLIIGEITTNALLCTPHLGGRGVFVVLVLFCPRCLWVSVRCAGVEQTHAPHLRATQSTFDCEGGWGLSQGLRDASAPVRRELSQGLPDPPRM